MIKKIEQIIIGKRCPKCSSGKLFKLSDGRYKCANCNFKYSPKKIENDLKILHYFSLEIPANKAAKDPGLSYKNVRNKYMQYRHEIVNYLAKQFQKLSGEIECDVRQLADGGRRRGISECK